MTILDNFVSVNNGDQLDDGFFNNSEGVLGEVKMVALSMSGAITKATMQGRGWAICDGTTPTSQGISSSDITTTPDLQDKFIQMSNDETSGTIGGQSTVAFSFINDHDNNVVGPRCTSIDGQSSNGSFDNRPPFYEVAYFMKVRI